MRVFSSALPAVDISTMDDWTIYFTPLDSVHPCTTQLQGFADGVEGISSTNLATDFSETGCYYGMERYYHRGRNGVESGGKLGKYPILGVLILTSGAINSNSTTEAALQ
jgi:hypothetical protein